MSSGSWNGGWLAIGTKNRMITNDVIQSLDDGVQKIYAL